MIYLSLKKVFSYIRDLFYLPKQAGYDIHLERLNEYAKEKRKDFFFIQIGSNDGKSGDPIFELVKKYNWAGILIEPVKYLFEKLKKNYKNNSNLTLINLAISKKNGSRKFYRLKMNNDNLPEWYDQIGSFYLKVLLKHKRHISNIEDYIISEDVECQSLKTLVKNNNISMIDLLHIDTEGYDFEILKMLKNIPCKPKMILYEHKHLSEINKWRSWRFIKRLGYKVHKVGMDSFAYL